jgi:hypothetical protein
MRIFIFLALIFVADSFFAVDSFAQQPEVENKSLKMYSVDVPETSMWKNNSDSNQLLFGRTLGSPISTVALTAKTYPSPPGLEGSISELLVQVTKAANKEANMSGRHQLISHSERIAERSDLECVEYEKEWIDQGGAATNWHKLNMQAKGHICFHPESPYILVEANYSIRDHSILLHEKAINEGEHFINSLKFD